jgi:Zn-dependent M28 family amino/carboxypeptidase
LSAHISTPSLLALVSFSREGVLDSIAYCTLLFLGINDDGSGTATVAELARTLAKGFLPGKNAVRFAWWASTIPFGFGTSI